MVSFLQLCMSEVERNARMWYISIWVEILWWNKTWLDIKCIFQNFNDCVLQHDVNELAIEIARWKEGCQEALRRLHKASILLGYQLSMTRLLETFGIAPEMVGYNADTEDFDLG